MRTASRSRPTPPPPCRRFPPTSRATASGLARWLLSPEHPLTARVTVNRAWQMMFGQGIVETSDNFGSQGSLPTHPELLDWLAREFVDHGWDMKRLLKLIAMSATYRQSSQASPGIAGARSRQRTAGAWPGPPAHGGDAARPGAGRQRIAGREDRRAERQAVSARRAVGGKAMGAPQYDQGKGDDLYRRSLYTFWKRTVPHPAMIAFDAADRNVCTVRRQSTSTPLQALALLNDTQIIEAARHLGQRMLKEGGKTTGRAGRLGVPPGHRPPPERAGRQRC